MDSVYSLLVEVYSVPTDDQKTYRLRSLAGVLIGFAILSVSYFLLDWLWPSSRPARSVARSATTALIFSSVMIVVGVTRSSGRLGEYSITVDGDLIVGKWSGGLRKVRRGEIRTIVESKTNFLRDGGLLISDRGRFGAFMWGGVWIPRTLPEYEYLKRVAEMWKAQNSEQL